MQSRLLAKRFEQKEDGRRLSRLPPRTIENEFGKRRPPYYRSQSADSDETDGQSPEREEEHANQVNPQGQRPMSHHPTIESDDWTASGHYENTLSPLGEEPTPPQEQPIQPAQDYFTIPRAHSPEQIETRVEEATPNTPGSKTPQQSQVPTSAQHTPVKGLMPPRSPAQSKSPRASPSIRSVQCDSSDDAENASMGGSFDSLPYRQISSSNTEYSRSHSPSSPARPVFPRSPSVASDRSAGGTLMPRPAYNFSRPMGGRPSLDARDRAPSRTASRDRAPSRQGSGDSRYIAYNESVHTPVSITSEDYMAAHDPNNAATAPSYIYTKYDLPRGRTLQRDSVGAATFISQQFHWDGSRAGSSASERPPSPPSPPKTANSDNAGSRSMDVPRSDAPSVASSDATIRAQMSRPTSSGASSGTAVTRIADMTAQQHLDKGVEFHEKGEVQKSTYHLRLAARAGLPTAMLLYALACRHGWGMRPNQAEGVQWLRKAVDSAQLEVADDEDLVTKGKAGPDVTQRKTHKAQFALSVYELGVSYMNGWGIQQDRSLALRCFEIAGNWGDGDALAEAGFCWAQGVGCKKDLKKAAKFYRSAEAKGISMAGNSWIYKDKYMDKESDGENSRGRSASKDGRKGRDKSRTRTIFSRKKSVAA
ncbi:uncharacterized protein K452DRAFT_282868 [Aplosporella prunicola CBS 121167]|uniref:Cell cycle inhibitor Nif1 n=1 Tax=Aplosporella prunicola CBS 121167 TaxID=1176127 RepID=A0A6A6BV46_9PEZI|nr:uncharacterized protein K452DRAFT_282868 [Aplosporella prunicola CBS 121167]KAF2146687.1 hypothetical protein K452DRAFT_282868 [Aplosporella prunicola CBS 121167]